MIGLDLILYGDTIMAFSERAKKDIFDKAGGRCEHCGKMLCFDNHEEGERGAWEPHHRVARASGGSDLASNGIALCLACHKQTYSYGKKL